MSAEHNHSHSHSHSHDISSHDELVAVLRYMADHNIHHAEELERMAQSNDVKHNPQACEKLCKAIESYKEGNALLCEALEIIGKTEGE